jgi:hypothetical protein
MAFNRWQPGCCCGGLCSVEVCVTDACGAPLEGATVTWTHGSSVLTSTTNSYGCTLYLGLEVGLTYTLTITYDGCPTLTTSRSITTSDCGKTYTYALGGDCGKSTCPGSGTLSLTDANGTYDMYDHSGCEGLVYYWTLGVCISGNPVEDCVLPNTSGAGPTGVAYGVICDGTSFNVTRIWGMVHQLPPKWVYPFSYGGAFGDCTTPCSAGTTSDSMCPPGGCGGAFGPVQCAAGSSGSAVITPACPGSGTCSVPMSLLPDVPAGTNPLPDPVGGSVTLSW